MDNPNRLKLRVSRMFRSSFGSCSSRNMDIIEKAVVVPQARKSNPLIDPKSAKPRPYPSIHKTDKTSSLQTINNPCFIPNENTQQLLLSPFPICPPATPSSPSYGINLSGYGEKPENSTRIKKKVEETTLLHGSSSHEMSFEDWFSSDDEREDEYDFSSRSVLSVSSDSSDSRRYRRRKQSTSRKRFQQRRSDNVVSGNSTESMSMNYSFAVVKNSSDPYSDFRTSMVEMIVEKELFSEEELEGLLHCFLSLNSEHHHEVIVDVFTEIWHALFSSSK